MLSQTVPIWMPYIQFALYGVIQRGRLGTSVTCIVKNGMLPQEYAEVSKKRFTQLLQKPVEFNILFLYINNIQETLIGLKCINSLPVYKTQFLKTNIKITSAVGFIKYSTSDTTTQKWNLAVNRQFAINITVLWLYVPYSKECRNSMMSVIEPKGSDSVVIEYFCGMVRMENVFSQGHLVILTLSPQRSVSAFNTTLHAVYQIMSPGKAYRLRQRMIHFPPTWNINVLASTAIIYDLQILYF